MDIVLAAVNRAAQKEVYAAGDPLSTQQWHAGSPPHAMSKHARSEDSPPRCEHPFLLHNCDPFGFPILRKGGLMMREN